MSTKTRLAGIAISSIAAFALTLPTAAHAAASTHIAAEAAVLMASEAPTANAGSITLLVAWIAGGAIILICGAIATGAAVRRNRKHPKADH